MRVCVARRVRGAAWNSSIVFYQSYAAVIIMLGRDVVEKRMTERCWLKQLRPLKPTLKCCFIQTDSYCLYLTSVLMQRTSQKLSCSNQCLQRYCVIQTLQINHKRGKPSFFSLAGTCLHAYTKLHINDIQNVWQIPIVKCFINLFWVRKKIYKLNYIKNLFLLFFY